MKISKAILLGLATALAAMLVAPALASADSSNPQIRIAYLAPASGNADVYIDGTKALSAVAYKTVSTYLQVSAGSHHVVLTAPGGSTSSPMAQTDVDATSGSHSTVAVGGKTGALKAQSFSDDFGSPASDQAVARFLHMAPEVPGVDVVVPNGPTVFTNVSFLQASPYKQLPPASYDIQLRATGTSQVLFSVNGVALKAGEIVTFTGIGGVGQPVELLQIPDAGSMPTSPNGGANTGAGGTSLPIPASSLLVGLGLIGCAFLLPLVIARRPRTLRGPR